MIMETELEEATQAPPTVTETVDDIASEDAATPVTSTEEREGQADAESIDYARLAEEDLATLRREFPTLRSVRSIAELPNCARYGALRDLGLSPKEAYLAIGGGAPTRQDNRAHLRSSVPRAHAGITSMMTGAELESARMLFGNLSDSEINRLYRKVQS